MKPARLLLILRQSEWNVHKLFSWCKLWVDLIYTCHKFLFKFLKQCLNCCCILNKSTYLAQVLSTNKHGSAYLEGFNCETLGKDLLHHVPVGLRFLSRWAATAAASASATAANRRCHRSWDARGAWAFGDWEVFCWPLILGDVGGAQLWEERSENPIIWMTDWFTDCTHVSCIVIFVQWLLTEILSR